MKKRFKQVTGIVMTCAMLSASMMVPAFGAEPAAGSAAQTDEDSGLYGQLTLEDIDALNGGSSSVYMHNGHVTLVDGTCTEYPVTDMKDAAEIVDSMTELMGGNSNTVFTPWREVTDPKGNTYYIFQQMYHDTTVLGGAAKVIVDSDKNMVGLSCSVESEMPDVNAEEGITAPEAEQIVVDREYKASGQLPEVLEQYTDRVVLPSVLEFDIENEDESSRFVWVVYTNNLSDKVKTGSDLPYLAHYVSMSGEYLYNLPAIAPDDEAGRSGYDASYIFEFMDPVDYTGYVDLSDGSEKEIHVTLMRDRRTGMYYLGNIERRIVVAQCYDFLYGGGQVVLESSPDNMEWDQVGLLSLYNYCRAWDYYNEIGWTGGDGEGTPIIILNNFCDDHYNEVNNACYVGEIYGMQVFLASKINDLSQCLDVIAHEFTHCVTHSLTTYNSYKNDYGAINEGMSDVQGKNCEMMMGDTQPDNWTLGDHSKISVRSMSDPHLFSQPEYTWDEYYIANAKQPGSSNDHGGVHVNSSLLNQISYILVQEGGMTFDEAREFWFMTDAAMVPGTDYVQLAELLPWVLKTAGLEKYQKCLEGAISRTKLSDKDMPQTMDEEHAMIRMSLPDTEAFDTGNWMMLLTSVKVDQLISRGSELVDKLMNEDFSFLPESVEQALEENKKKGEETQARIEEEGFLVTLLEDLAESLESGNEDEAKAAEEEQKREMLKKDLVAWLKEEARSFVFTSYGFAGQDGSTLNMVVKPGRCIPMLQHVTHKEGSDQPDQVVMAIYVHGRWYDVGIAQLLEAKELAESSGEEENFNLPNLPEQIITEVLEDVSKDMKKIRSLDDVLDLFTVDIKGGEIVEILPDGLDQIEIPEPTPASEKPYGTIKPGKMSRPKPQTETEAVTEAEETAQETEKAV